MVRGVMPMVSWIAKCPSMSGRIRTYGRETAISGNKLSCLSILAFRCRCKARGVFPNLPGTGPFSLPLRLGALKIEQKGVIVPVPNGQTENDHALLPLIARSLLWVHIASRLSDK